MSKIGYERCSTVDQNPKRQEELLKALGCDKVFLDMMSGKNMDRPQLKAMMDYLKPEVVLVHGKMPNDIFVEYLDKAQFISYPSYYEMRHK